MDIDYKGNTHTFPDDFSKDQIRTALMKYDVMHPSQDLQAPNSILKDNPSTPYSKPVAEMQARFNEPLGPKIASSLPMAGAAVGGLEGGVGAVPGAALGSVIKQALQGYSPSTFGESPKDVGDNVLETGKDTLINGVLPGFLGKALTGIKGIPGYLASKLAGAKNPAVQDFVESNASKFTGGTQDAADVANSRYQGTAPEGSAIADLKNGKPLDSVINKIYGDVKQAQQWKALTGETGTLQQLSLDKLVSKGYSAGNKTINASKILDELGENKEYFNEALTPQTKSNLEDFLTKAKTFEPPPAPQGTLGKIIQYEKNRLVYHLGASTIGGAVGGAPGAIGGVILTNVALNKLMMSPTVGRLAIQALETPASAAEAPLLSKVITNSLRGTIVYLQLPDGKTEKAYVNQDGQLTYPPSGK